MPLRPRSPGPRPRLLLLAATTIVAVLGYLLWRTSAATADLQRVATERLQAQAERIVQRAASAPAAFAALPAARRARVAADGVVACDEIAWLDVVASPVDRDLVVEDRLERATCAEFTPPPNGGVELATRAFDQLLAAILVPAVRLQVVVAAAWQARRAGALGRLQSLRQEVDGLLDGLVASDLARPAMANAVAAAWRLAADPRPAWAERLLPWLPAAAAAGLQLPPDLGRQQQAIEAQRAHRRALRDAFRAQLPPAAAAMPAANLATAGWCAASHDTVLWWQPLPGGGHDVALVAPGELLAAFDRAGRHGALPELPPGCRWVPAADTTTAAFGVPGLAAVVDATAPNYPAWLQPVLLGSALLLLGGFVSLSLRLQLRAARREVMAARTQSEFLTTVTHELKTPLAGIRLLAEMLASGRAGGRAQEYYGMLSGEAERLSQLIENVLDLGRLERGERAYDRRPCDVVELVRTTLAWFAPVAARDGLQLQWAEPPMAMVAVIDRDAFVQALVAVLDNARKYGAGGGKIELATSVTTDRLRVDVRDHGAGVPAAERERVFARFVRGAAHRHGSTPGVGIGLYLARTIARRLGGELEVGDPVDGASGARFTFWLPREVSA